MAEYNKGKYGPRYVPDEKYPDFSILETISRADAEAAPDAESAADYARRYVRWRALTEKLGEWAVAARADV